MLDLSADRRTVEAWIELLQDTFLVTRLERRRKKASKRLRSRPKLYASDHGLIMAFAASPDPVNDPEVRARVFEAVVYRHLRSLGLNTEPTYLRIDDDLEADFVLESVEGPILIEVTTSRQPKARKLERLRELGEKVGAIRRVLIYDSVAEGKDGDQENEVTLLPLLRFLLEPEAVLSKEERS